jgi:leader peptidase (prepilin peptidase)/N-methyltransferase
MATFFVFIIGSVFGSFTNLVIDRWDSDQSFIYGQSHCDSCQHSLNFGDLLPLIPRFRCFYCKAKLSYWHLFFEWSFAFLFLFAWFDLDLPVFLTILLSFILLKFDIKSHSFPFIIWAVFALFFCLFFASSLSGNYIWLIFALCATLWDLKIGAGDFLWFFIASFSLTFLQLIQVIQIASLLGIIYYLSKKRKEKRGEIPFIPFLAVGYLAVILLHRIL